MDARTTILLDNLRFPEAPRWHEGRLWFSDVIRGRVLSGRVMNVDMAGNARAVVNLADAPSGLGWTPDGHLLIVSAQARRLLRLEGDRLEQAADMSGLVPYPCNDMVVDLEGRAYVGNMGYELGNLEDTVRPAPILLVTPRALGTRQSLSITDGEARVVAENMAFPNGMVITPDGNTLIVAESYAERLTAFTIESDGSLSGGRTWAQFGEGGYPAGLASFREGQITPDGICLDAEGAVWIASPNTKDVLRVREGGVIASRVPVETIPLACMLGGPEGCTLFLTTTESLEPGNTGATGRIETVRVDVPGAGLP